MKKLSYLKAPENVGDAEGDPLYLFYCDRMKQYGFDDSLEETPCCHTLFTKEQIKAMPFDTSFFDIKEV